jgi:hypothetical protein
VAKYALEGLPNKVMASEYRTALPDEKELAAELERTQAILADRRRTAITSTEGDGTKEAQKQDEDTAAGKRSRKKPKS